MPAFTEHSRINGFPFVYPRNWSIFVYVGHIDIKHLFKDLVHPLTVGGVKLVYLPLRPLLNLGVEKLLKLFKGSFRVPVASQFFLKGRHLEPLPQLVGFVLGQRNFYFSISCVPVNTRF